MKPPGWLVMEPGKGTLSEDGKSVVFMVRVRRWHPGLWIAVVRYWLRGGSR